MPSYYEIDGNWMVNQAVREIKETYGDDVSVLDKRKSLVKFGRNANIGTSPVTVAESGDEEFQTDNTIDKIVCTDAAFTGDIYVEGHTISGGLLTFASQVATLNGQTPVSLTTPLRQTKVKRNS